MKKDLSFLKENLIAHRGAHNINKGIPENSIKSFEEAIKHNYIIELDIHLLKDNNIVVFHDDDLKRMTGLNKKIKDTTYEEIKDLKLQNTDNYIPLFKDVLELVDGKVPIIVEFKHDVKCGRLEKETMKLLNKYKGKYVMKSFNPLTLIWFKKNYPDVIRGQLSYNFKGKKINLIHKFFCKNMLLNFITKPDFISYGIKSMPNKKINKYRKDILILGWTIKTKKDLEKAKKYCDNFICENLEELNN
ncbi:MAG: glycerophosphodiester phosphodiesterase [Lactobacillales bacterium]|nr:glycerophosphodiester phosphodiesterase [Lactobacillales bacterium]